MPKHRKALPSGLRFDVLLRCNFACYYCGLPASLGAVQLHIEHVVPVSLGGTDDPWNLVASCWPCNGGKTNIVPPEWLVRQVYDDWVLFSNSRGRPVEQCCHCRIPIWSEPDDDPGDRCLACDEAVCNANEEGFRTGWDMGYSKGERDAVESFADYIVKQRKGGV